MNLKKIWILVELKVHQLNLKTIPLKFLQGISKMEHQNAQIDSFKKVAKISMPST